jgi:glycosyltransferase involved in cell wall biosynthesis
MTLFSLVIPVYNIEKYLPDCIDSIISQSYDNLQILLIDDGSKDKSGAICDEYALLDNRIEVIHKNNGGVVSARLQGIRNSRGDYIVCIDGDDWLEKDFFNKLNAIIQAYSPDVICTGYKSIGNEISKYTVPYEEGFYNSGRIQSTIFPSLICDEFGKIFPQHLWAKAFKNCDNIRKYFDIDEAIDMGEDSAIVIPIISSIESLYIYNESIYCYRYNPESLSKSKKALKWENPKIWYKEIVSKADNNRYDFSEQINRSGALSVFYIAASQFNVDGKYSDISKTIKDQLEDKLFQHFIKHAKFNKKCKQRLKVIVLRYRLIFLLKLFCDTYYKNRK